MYLLGMLDILGLGLVTLPALNLIPNVAFLRHTHTHIPTPPALADFVSTVIGEQLPASWLGWPERGQTNETKDMGSVPQPGTRRHLFSAHSRCS